MAEKNHFVRDEEKNNYNKNIYYNRPAWGEFILVYIVTKQHSWMSMKLSINPASLAKRL